MLMQLYYIRHGQSLNNALGDAGKERGSHDPELTQIGEKQAELVAEFVRCSNPEIAVNRGDFQNHRGFGITHIYCSLTLRAVATGNALAQKLALPLTAWVDLHEAGGIYWEDKETGEKVGRSGEKRSYFQKHYPNLLLPDSLGEEGWWNRPYETPEEVPARGQRVLNELLLRHGGTADRVAFVSHGEFYNHFIHAAIGCRRSRGFWFLLNNTAISRLDFRKEEIALIYTNRTDFLPPELIT